MELIYILYLVVALLFVPVLIWGIVAQAQVQSTFEKYSKTSCMSGYTADAVAKTILDKNGVGGVEITNIPGQLTDNYDPKRKVVSLSSSVFGSTSISAIGVAAHECGHVIQHHKGYLPIKIRTALVPIVNFFSRMFLPLLVVGIVFSAFSSFFYATIFIYVAIGFYGFSTLFSLVTLPVEFDASKRALKELEQLGFLSKDEISAAREVLRAAAMTYVVSFFTSLIYLLHFVLRILIITGIGRRR